MTRIEIVLTFRSTHDAMNGERLLLEAGVKTKIMPLPSTLGAGCGLCLRIADEDMPLALRLLRTKHTPEGVYAKKPRMAYPCIRR